MRKQLRTFSMAAGGILLLVGLVWCVVDLISILPSNYCSRLNAKYTGQTVEEFLRGQAIEYSRIRLMDEPPGRLAALFVPITHGGMEFNVMVILSRAPERPFDPKRRWDKSVVLACRIAKITRPEIEGYGVRWSDGEAKR